LTRKRAGVAGGRSGLRVRPPKRPADRLGLV